MRGDDTDSLPTTPAHLLGYFPLQGAPCTACGIEAGGQRPEHRPSVARVTFLVLGDGPVWLDVCRDHLIEMRRALASRGARGGVRLRQAQPVDLSAATPCPPRGRHALLHS